MKRKILILGMILVGAFFLGGGFGAGEVWAQQSTTTREIQEGIPTGPTAGEETDFISYLGSIYKFGVIAAGFLALFMIGLGSFSYIVTSAGNAAKMADAKAMIFNAIYGLVLAMIAWLILFIINPDFVGGKFEFKGTTVQDIVADDIN